MRHAVFVVALFAALTAPACKLPPPTTPTGHVIDCSKEALQECGPGLLPAVDTCLAGAGDVTACLIGLVQPATCATEGLVACLTRHAGAEFEHAAKANGDDVRSFREADRAKEFLKAYSFVGDPAVPAAPSVP